MGKGTDRTRQDRTGQDGNEATTCPGVAMDGWAYFSKYEARALPSMPPSMPSPLHYIGAHARTYEVIFTSPLAALRTETPRAQARVFYQSVLAWSMFAIGSTYSVLRTYPRLLSLSLVLSRGPKPASQAEKGVEPHFTQVHQARPSSLEPQALGLDPTGIGQDRIG